MFFFAIILPAPVALVSIVESGYSLIDHSTFQSAVFLLGRVSVYAVSFLRSFGNLKSVIYLSNYLRLFNSSASLSSSLYEIMSL